MMSYSATVVDVQPYVNVSRQLYENNKICRHVSFSDFVSGVSLLLLQEYEYWVPDRKVPVQIQGTRLIFESRTPVLSNVTLL